MEVPKWSGTMAKQYPFALDPFQTAAIACIERRESVLVAAHTSGELAGLHVIEQHNSWHAVAVSTACCQRTPQTSWQRCTVVSA
jgi:hypothetical protein